MGSQQGAEAALTERERELLDLYAPMVTGGRVLNGRAQARQVRDAHPALVADYAARLDALVASLTAARQHAEYWERAFKGAHSRATAARQREQQLTQALTEISLHQVLSPESDKGQVCDWHCTARLVEIAASVLAGEAPPTAPPEPRA